MLLNFPVYSMRKRFLPNLKLGDIVLTSKDVYFPTLGTSVPYGEEWLVVVLAGSEGAPSSKYPDIRIAPIGRKRQNATDSDLLCAAADGPIGSDFHIELWNQRPMLLCNVLEKIGFLSTEAIDRLIVAHNHLVGIEVEESRLMEWLGTPLTSEDDPRIAIMDSQVDRAAFLSDPVEEMLHDQGFLKERVVSNICEYEARDEVKIIPPYFNEFFWKGNGRSVSEICLSAQDSWPEFVVLGAHYRFSTLPKQLGWAVEGSMTIPAFHAANDIGASLDASARESGQPA